MSSEVARRLYRILWSLKIYGSSSYLGGPLLINNMTGFLFVRSKKKKRTHPWSEVCRIYDRRPAIQLSFGSFHSRNRLLVIGAKSHGPPLTRNLINIFFIFAVPITLNNTQNRNVVLCTSFHAPVTDRLRCWRFCYDNSTYFRKPSIPRTWLTLSFCLLPPKMKTSLVELVNTPTGYSGHSEPFLSYMMSPVMS